MGVKPLPLHQLYRTITRRLRVAAGEHAAREAALLLGQVLGVAATAVHLDPERPLGSEQCQAVMALVERRQAQEPLQYILGQQEFWSLDFRVEPGVLIPRPETELLVEAALALKPRLAADIGTGSGAIAVALAVHAPDCRVYAVDSSADAVRLALANAVRHGVADRVFCLHGDLLAPLVDRGLTGQLAVIISNPPYIPRAELDRLPPTVRDYEPRLALDGGEDGLSFYRRLALAHTLLAPCGKLLLEVGLHQAGPVQDILSTAGWCTQKVLLDYAGIPRVIQAAMRGDHGVPHPCAAV